MALRALSPVLLAFLIAGCVDETLPDAGTGLSEGNVVPLPEGVTANDDGTLSLAWGLTDCKVVVAFVPVDAAALAPHTPEGFTLVGPEGAGLPPDPRGDAVFGVELFTCAEGIGLNETPTTYGSYFWFAEPPADLKQDVDLHFVKRDVLIPDDDRRAFLMAQGIPARDGEVTMDLALEPGPVMGRLGSLSFEGGEGFSLRSLGALPEESFVTGSFEEYTMTPNGLARWTTNFINDPAPLIGAALIEVTAGSFAEAILGGPAAVGYVMVATGSFVDGRIELPAPPEAPAGT